MRSCSRTVRSLTGQHSDILHWHTSLDDAIVSEPWRDQLRFLPVRTIPLRNLEDKSHRLRLLTLSPDDFYTSG